MAATLFLCPYLAQCPGWANPTDRQQQTALQNALGETWGQITRSLLLIPCTHHGAIERQRVAKNQPGKRGTASAGINRHIVGEEEALQEKWDSLNCVIFEWKRV